jgi:hypothetical protein
MMRKLLYLVLGVVIGAAGPVAAQDTPAALIVRLEGAVEVRQGEAAPAPAVAGTGLAAGDEVIPAAGARATLIVPSGATLRVTETTTILAPPAGVEHDLFRRAVTTLAQAATTDATAGGRQGMIRPIPGQTTLVAPRNGLTINSERPSFAWTASEGQSYELMLRKIDGGRPEIFEVGSDTTWTYPEDLDPLEFGAQYSWTVFVGGRQGGRPLPQQEFRVIDIVEFAELTEFLDEITLLGLEPMGDGLFLTVVALRDLDLFYDADEAMNNLEDQGGMSADLYMLKGEILNTLGREAEARAAFDKADAIMR